MRAKDIIKIAEGSAGKAGMRVKRRYPVMITKTKKKEVRNPTFGEVLDSAAARYVPPITHPILGVQASATKLYRKAKNK